MNVIRSAAERQAAGEFAKAAAMRPNIVGAALAKVARDKAMCDAMFDVLEVQQLLQSSELQVTLIPKEAGILAQLQAANATRPEPR